MFWTHCRCSLFFFCTLRSFRPADLSIYPPLSVACTSFFPSFSSSLLCATVPPSTDTHFFEFVPFVIDSRCLLQGLR